MVGLIFGKDAKFNRKAKVEPRSSQGRARSSQVEPGRARSSQVEPQGRARSSQVEPPRSSQVEPGRARKVLGQNRWEGIQWLVLEFPGPFRPNLRQNDTETLLHANFPSILGRWPQSGLRVPSISSGVVLQRVSAFFLLWKT